ncbi:hypothetical protein Syun_027163 [Stephania yunnanensis]|uniref:Bulb-type lectin domain-containing protein n=1 Tax=Stephania yunnanensis TaxID=152371 RepID=A0AAP0EK78_9MAGN
MVSLISLLVFHSLFINRLCHATDTITYNKFLREGETIVSDGGTYALGFFSPGISKLSYIGIWYNKIPEKTVVWVANRNNPMKDSSMGVLKINEDGNLAIFNGNEADPVWSTKVSVPMSDNTSSTLIYKLLNTGNLVLRDENKEDILWQSFDYPTNTRLPGMKLGWNLKSGLNWSLTSWKSRDGPSTGDFTYNFDPTGAPEFFIKKGLRKLWRSGPWNGLAKTLHSSTYYYTFVNNPDEISIIANSYNTSVLSRFYLDELGIARRLNWIEDTQTWSNIWSAPDDTTDTITQDKFLRDGDGIVSNGGNFALGFFSPGNSQKRYIGIWFNKVSLRTVVWVANRDNPINNSSSGVFKINHSGNLAIFDGNSSNPVRSTNISISITEKTNSSTMFYKLLDSGNLVLFDGNKGDFLWQSFHYPTDTQLPGMKLGLSLKSGLNWSLTSWKSPDDPSTGEFSYSLTRMEAPEMVLKRRHKRFGEQDHGMGKHGMVSPTCRAVTSSITVL